MEDMYEKIKECRYCRKSKYKWGEFIWLNGKELCPECYKREREREDKILELEELKRKQKMEE